MSTTLKFFINKDKKSRRDNRYPIYLRVIHNRKKSEGRISLTQLHELELEFWDENFQRFNSKEKQFISYNFINKGKKAENLPSMEFQE